MMRQTVASTCESTASGSWNCSSTWTQRLVLGTRGQTLRSLLSHTTPIKTIDIKSDGIVSPSTGPSSRQVRVSKQNGHDRSADGGGYKYSDSPLLSYQSINQHGRLRSATHLTTLNTIHPPPKPKMFIKTILTTALAALSLATAEPIPQGTKPSPSAVILAYVSSRPPSFLNPHPARRTL